MNSISGVGSNKSFYVYWQSPDLPAPTMLAQGPAKEGGAGWIQLSSESSKMPQDNPSVNKPPYRVPSMAEIAAIPYNGYSAVSTFSGCGGSSLGYKMAGFKVLWANEFIPAAQETYRANHPDTLLDTRDIRKVSAQDILDAIQMQPGQLDVFDGSPPCASFSTAGKREAGWGKVKAYSDTKQRTDDLFFEYVRLIEGVQPKVFVAENVSGLVKGTAKGYFLEILAALKGAGYRVTAKLLDAQWLGVPQMRQRIIFVGVRNDLNAQPAHPKPLPYQYSVRDALPWIIEGRLVTAGNERHTLAGRRPTHDVGASAAPTITATESQFNLMNTRAYRDKRGRFGDVTVTTEPPAPTVLSDSIGTHWIVEPETDISRFAIGAEWDRMTGVNSDKYVNLKRPALDRPCNTITNPPNGTFSKTAASGSASVTHPTERRKFSIAELRRICAFPDDFILTGTYAQQWERLGRAVPPVMMMHIAATIRDEVLAKL